MKEIKYKPIGLVHSPFKEPRGTPIQPAAAKNVKGTVEIFPEFAKGLKDVDSFSHIILICHFHLSKSAPLSVVPYMDNETRGVFATRSPCRPNPIGLSTVRLDKIEGNILHIRDVDIINGTPLLDIKPYVPQFDKKEKIKTGWLEKNIYKLPKSKDNGRFENLTREKP